MILGQCSAHQGACSQVLAAMRLKLILLPACTLIFTEQLRARLRGRFAEKILWICVPQVKWVFVHFGSNVFQKQRFANLENIVDSVRVISRPFWLTLLRPHRACLAVGFPRNRCKPLKQFGGRGRNRIRVRM
jgi:hypothetical protein